MDYANSVTGKSSLFRILVEPGRKVFRFDVRIMCKCPDGKEFCLTKQTDSTLKSEDNKVCRQIVKFALARAESGISDGDYCYDGKAILYARNTFEGTLADFTAHAIRQDELLGYIGYRFHDDSILTVSITPNQAAPSIDYSVFKDAVLSEGTFTADHSVRTFLEMLTSEVMLAVTDFQNAHAGLLVKPQTPPKNEYQRQQQQAQAKVGMQLLEGLQKAVRMTDETTCWLILDMKLCYSYGAHDKDGEPANLGDIYAQFLQMGAHPNKAKRLFAEQFKGVRCVSIHDPSKAIIFHAMSKFGTSASEYNIDGKPVAEYYFNNYAIDLKHPEYPGVQTSVGVRKNEVIPLEALQVLPGQLVPHDKNSFEFNNCVKAIVRYRFIMDQVKKLSTGVGADFLANFGVKIVEESNDVTIKCLSLPKIRVRDAKSGDEKLIEVNPIDGSFFDGVQDSAFIYTPNVVTGNWIIAFDKQIQTSHIRNFVKRLVTSSRCSSFCLNDPIQYRPVELHNLEQIFYEATQMNNRPDEARVDMIMYIDRKEVDSHGLLKLFEANYKILTQHVTYQVTCDILQGKNQTLKNISMKFNSKCLGLNFLPEFEPCMEDLNLETNPDLLVIGYDVAHPAPASPFEFKTLKDRGYTELSSANPSVVGISANKTDHLAAFSGDFFYQESRRESLSTPLLEKSIQQIMECTYSKSQRKPTRIVVIRDGVSEGQYRMCIEHEVPAIRSGYKLGVQSINAHLSELGDKEALEVTEPQITFIVATKRHNKRFFRLDEDDKIQNTRPGDVIGSAVVGSGDEKDPKVTRQDIPESFVQTHHAIRGTPQITQYTVLVNDLNLSILKVQKFVLLLANMHQVTGCPTSLPLPVYLAHETAKRGQQVYNEFQRQSKQPRFKRPKFFRDMGVENAEKDLMMFFDKLTYKFGYAYSGIVHSRFNS